MNKKFLSAILFGALMVSSTGTFVSCKDYDDDITELWEAVNGNKSELTTKVSAIESSISSLQSAQSSLDSKIAATQSAAEKAALEAQKAAIAAAAEELATVKAALEAAIVAGDTKSGEAAAKALADAVAKLEAEDKACAEAAADALAKAQEEIEAAIKAGDDAAKATAEALKAADVELQEAIAEVSGQITALQAFQGTTEEALKNLIAADLELQKTIAALDAAVKANAAQIGANKAAIDAQIAALEAYKTSNDAVVAGQAEQIEALIADLKKLAEGQVTEAKVSEIAAKVSEELGAELDLISAAFNKKITHISLSENTNVNSYYKSLYLMSAEAITDYTFGEGTDAPVVFKKGEVETFEDNFILRVSPANAVLDKDMIKIVNSKMEDLNGLVDILSVEPYTGLLTTSRGVSENGLWKVTVKLNNKFTTSDYYKAAYDANWNNINYAVMVGDSLKDERQIVSEYALYLYQRGANAEHVLNYYVNNGSVNNIKNRYNGTNRTATENGGVTKYEEASWNLFNHWNAAADKYIYDYAGDFTNPNKTGFNQGNTRVNIIRATNDIKNENYAELHYGKRTEHYGNDVRSELEALRVDAGKPFTVKFSGSYWSEAVRAYYVTLDEQNAVESQPSEIRAWESYKIEGLNKMTAGNEALQLTIPASAGADGDYIGFRVYAVNYDGTLVDPDGKAFYVYVGEQSTVAASVTLKMNSKLVVPLAETMSSSWVDFSTADWSAARGGSYELVIKEGNTNVTEYLGVDSENFQFINSRNGVVNLLTETGASTSTSNGHVNKTLTGKLIGDATDIYDEVIASIVKIRMIDVKPGLLKDDVTYTANLTIKGANAAILARASISFTKEMPSFPTNVAPTTGMFVDGNVMVFPTPGTSGAATFPMTSAWEGLHNSLKLTWTGVANINADLNNSLFYDQAYFNLTVSDDYLNPNTSVNPKYAAKLPMQYEYNYGPISYPYNSYSGVWTPEQDWVTTSKFTLQLGNYVNESTLTMDAGINVTYPGAAGKQSAIELSKLHMTDWYGQAIDLRAVMENQMVADSKEAKYIASAEVFFVTNNAAKEENEFYEFGYLGKAQYDKYGEFARYARVDDDFWEFDANGNQTKKYKLTLKDCDVIVMNSVKDATTGSTAPTKIRIKFVDTFGYTITKTTSTSFNMNYKQ